MMKTTIHAMFVLLFLPVASVVGDDAAESSDTAATRIEQFEQAMSGVALVGRFTTTGGDVAPQEERYDILDVTKSDDGDWWVIRARIRYGQHDLTVPVPVEVKWAGDTPVITVDELTLPGFGTFDSRVVIRGDRYAGTWQHGDTGGHLFGVIERTEGNADEED